MELEELQAHIDRFIEAEGINGRLVLDYEVAVVEAARLVANPDITIWICRVLHLAFIKGDETGGARIGLPAFCAKELHQDCGWLAAFTPQGDTK